MTGEDHVRVRLYQTVVCDKCGWMLRPGMFADRSVESGQYRHVGGGCPQRPRR